MTVRDPWGFRDNFRRCIPWDLQGGRVVGGDVPWHVDVTEEEGARGVTKQVKYWRAMPCPRCVGTGGDPRTALNLCSRCNGVGAASRSRKPGSNAKKSLCTFCTGRGKIPTILCPRCKGRSVLYEEHVESIQIPAGTRLAAGDGVVVRLRPRLRGSARRAVLRLDGHHEGAKGHARTLRV